MLWFLVFVLCVTPQAASEVENIKGQMRTLFKELQQAQSKLDEAEGMKKGLQDRSDERFRSPSPSSFLTRRPFIYPPVQMSGGGARRGDAEGPAGGETGRADGERPSEAAAGQHAGAEPDRAEEGWRGEVRLLPLPT